MYPAALFDVTKRNCRRPAVAYLDIEPLRVKLPGKVMHVRETTRQRLVSDLHTSVQYPLESNGLP